jgi:nickel transport protein
MPQTSPVQRRSILKSGIALSPRALCHKAPRPGKATRLVAGTGPGERYLYRMLRFAFIIVLFLATALVPAPSAAFDLFATHEVTVQFATHDGKPMGNAEVQVFAPGDAKAPVITGRTDAEGKFVFDADQDGFWSAEAKGADQVARVMIRVGGESQTSQSRISPFLVIGVLAVLLALAIWYRLLRARSRRPRS